jgi:hypothetical protein
MLLGKGPLIRFSDKKLGERRQLAFRCESVSFCWSVSALSISSAALPAVAPNLFRLFSLLFYLERTKKC